MLQVLESCGEMRQTARIRRGCPYGILRTVPVVFTYTDGSARQDADTLSVPASSVLHGRQVKSTSRSQET